MLATALFSNLRFYKTLSSNTWRFKASMAAVSGSKTHSRKGVLAVSLVLCLGSASTSWALDTPEGSVILTISGNIEHSNATVNGEPVAQFDHDMLQAIGRHTTHTSTPWHEGSMMFEGPLMRDVLAEVGAQGERLIAIALNDYEADIPVVDAVEYDVILATHANELPMSVREHGPTFVIYPFDDHPELHQEVIYSRSAWQVNRLIVE